MEIELTVDPEAAADIQLADAESIEEWEDELAHLFDESDEVTVGFAARDSRLTVPEAMRVLVQALEGRSTRVRCAFTSERALRSAARFVPSLRRPDRAAQLGGLEVVVMQGDIVAVEADAIVNASNVRLELGAGVSGAIRRAAAHADALQAHMSSLAPIEPGAVVATPSHGLPCVRHILHAATASGREDVVARAYADTLALADRMGFTSLATPALGCGTGGLSTRRSAELLRQAIEQRASWQALRTLRCVPFDAETADAFAEVFEATLA
ncbi:MAG: macro domain-containing protein [Sandaracinus sp.]|nr:macro domain-containing protein [Sandaracinus sp.]